VTSTTRVEAFSDGVLAIAITLLVLDLRVPLRDGLHTSLAHALARQWPSYAAYVTSFLIIGIIWVNHHAVFGYLGAADRMLLFLNLVLLMFVAAIPFTTSLFAEYLTAGRDALIPSLDPRCGCASQPPLRARRRADRPAGRARTPVRPVRGRFGPSL